MRDRDQEADDARRGAWLDHFFFFFSSGCDSRAWPASVTKPYMQNVRNSRTDDAADDETLSIPFCRAATEILREIIFVESGSGKPGADSATSLPRNASPTLRDRKAGEGTKTSRDVIRGRH